MDIINSNPIDFLNANRGIKTKLQSLYNRLESIRSAAEISSHVLEETSDRRPENKHVDKMGTYAALTGSIEQDIRQAQQVHVEMIRIIMTVQDPAYQDTLIYYFVDGLSYSQISIKMDCSTKTISRYIKSGCNKIFTS